jgi:hypothetical protein
MPEPIPIRKVTETHRIEDIEGDHIRLSHYEAIPAKERRVRKKPWRGARMFALVDPTIMEKFEATISERRAIDYVLAHTILETGSATVVAARMGQELDWSPTYAARIIRQLVARNAIIELAPKTYRVNAFLAYRGDVSSWNEQTMIDPEPEWSKS